MSEVRPAAELQKLRDFIHNIRIKLRGIDYTQRPDLGLEMAKRGAEYDAKIAETEQRLAEYRAKAYQHLAYEPDFKKYVKIGQTMTSIVKHEKEEGILSYFDLLTKDEQDKYNYMLGKYGEYVAAEYWKTVLPSAQHKYGQMVARGIQNSDWKTGALIANSIGTGITNFMAGGLGAFGALTGQEIGENGLNYASLYIKEDLGKLGRFAYDMGVTVGNMLPSILIGGSAGIAAMGVSAGGNAYQQGLREGMTEGQAWAYGMAVGVSEALLQRFMGGIGRLGGVSDDVVKAISGVENGILKFALKTGWSAVKEGAEESLQAVLEPIFKAIFAGEILDVNWSEVVYNGLMGMLTGGVFEGVNYAPSESGTVSSNYTEEQAAKIRHEGKTFRNLVAGIDTSVSTFFRQWREGRKSHLGQKLEKLYLGALNADTLGKLGDILGYEVNARDVIVTNDDTKHIIDHHPELENWVFDALPYVVAAPDSVEAGHEGKGRNAKKLV